MAESAQSAVHASTGRCTNAHGLHLPVSCKAEPRESTKGCAPDPPALAWPKISDLSPACFLLLAHAYLLGHKSAKLSAASRKVCAGLDPRQGWLEKALANCWTGTSSRLSLGG